MQFKSVDVHQKHVIVTVEEIWCPRWNAICRYGNKYSLKIRETQEEKNFRTNFLNTEKIYERNEMGAAKMLPGDSSRKHFLEFLTKISRGAISRGRCSGQEPSDIFRKDACQTLPVHP